MQNGATTSYGTVQCADSTHFRKTGLGNVALCTADLYRSGSVNSFLLINGFFGLLRGIFTVCPQGHTECACLKEIVLPVQVCIPQPNMLEVLCKDEPFHCVQVERSAEIRCGALGLAENVLY